MRLLLVCGVILFVRPVHAAVSTFQDGPAGYSGTRDTYIDAASPATSFGNANEILIDLNSPAEEQQGLLRFDNIFGNGAGQIPFGSVINAATLTIDVVNPSVAGAQISLHRMLINWGEASTWSSLVGGVQRNDGDSMSVFDAQVSDPTASGVQVITGLAGALQAWSDGAANYGWVFVINNVDGWDFSSSEELVVASRPLLTVDWSPGLCPGGVVTTTADSGAGSLRECIEFANGFPGTTISFDVPGPGNRSAGADTWWVITPTAPLPPISAANTVIDGATQTTNRGNTNSRGPEVEIDGTGAGASTNGLVVGATGDGTTIRGLAVGNFSDNGILLLGANNNIEGNYLGLSADGTSVAANNTNNVTNQGGIRIESANNMIGGNTPAQRNVISANFFAGVQLFGAGATNNRVDGNYIGLDATGTLDRGNDQEGVDLERAVSNQIGGPNAGERNIISGNGSDGVEIDGGDFNRIWGNYIGTDVSGTVLIPNVRDGIDINESGSDGPTNNLIGGVGPTDGNLIRGNGIYGVQVRGASSVDNTIHGNRIYGNVALDIDLNDDGITVNDALDADTGSNHLMNHPVIVAAQESGGMITVYYSLDVPAADYRIEFFNNPSGAHASGHGGGELIAGATTIIHGGTGVENFVFSFAGSTGDVITATATEHFGGSIYGSTSEFSAAVTTIAGQLCPGGIIDTTVDSITGGSLRSCIIRANFNPGADILTVPAGTFMLTIAGTGENAAVRGDLDITGDLTLIGAGATSTIIDGNSVDRIFDVVAGTVNISGITARNGNLTSTGGGFLNNGNLILSEVTISGNSANHGGGIDNLPGASLALSKSTISGNTATSVGGGVRDRGTSVMTNVTVSGNTANEGGGISLRDDTSLLNATVTGNSAVQGGGIQSQGLPSASTVKNTVVAGNPVGGDCIGGLTNLGNNLDSDGSCAFGLTDPVPLLGPLQDNGGPTFTHALISGSPAIDAGDSSVCVAPANDTDQRGFPRPVGASCDIGAYEGEIVQLNLGKAAFWKDGTPIPSGATIPSGVEFKYLLYINNPGFARSDVSVRDVLDSAFQYQPGTIQVDNSVAECAAAVCTPAEEQTIFAAVDGAAILTDAIDSDVASYTGTTVDAGNGNVGNLQLDIAANAVWAILFSVKMP